MEKNNNKIGVVDFGGQYAHLLARNVRKLGVYSEILSPNLSLKDIKNLKLNYCGLIFSGGPKSVYNSDLTSIFKNEIFDSNYCDLPILGICFGHQLMSHKLGGVIKSKQSSKEYGSTLIKLIKNNEKLERKMMKNEDNGDKNEYSEIFQGLKSEQKVYMSHGDSVTKLPEGFKIIATSEQCKIAAIENKSKKYFGFQFHPEVTHSENGLVMMKNFLKICKCKFDWDLNTFLHKKIAQIQDKVLKLSTSSSSSSLKNSNIKKKVLLLVSGGVDSSVCFYLLNKALGKENVIGIHIDHGLMRKNESNWVKDQLINKSGFTNLYIIDSSDLFLQRLKNISDPQKKRIIIGDTFIDVKNQIVDKIKSKKFKFNNNEKEEKPNDEDDDKTVYILGQGSIYPDIIESGSGNSKDSEVIKTHHNRVDKIRDLIKQGLVIEPISDLYKDEVRQIGKILNISDELIERHPFPGPGLAVRILCVDKNDNNNLEKENLEKENQILKNKFKDDFVKMNFDSNILPIKSVGVQGDQRTYSHPLVLFNKNEKNDNNNFEYDWNKIEILSTKMVNSCSLINRVILQLPEPEPESEQKDENQSNKIKKFYLKTENKYLTNKRIKLLQEVDDIVNKTIDFEIKQNGNNKLKDLIWQFPVVLAPFSTNQDDNDQSESIILRPISSINAMTASFSKLKKEIFLKIVKNIRKKISKSLIDHIYFDITNKPPSTIEWE